MTTFALCFAEMTETTATVISIGTIVLLLLVLVVLSACNKKMDTRSIAFAGVSIALSFALSFVKFKVNANGGSITAASMLPIILYAYFFGPYKGLIVGLVHGLLQFVESAYVISPLSFFLDYPLAFAGVAFAGVMGIVMKNKPKAALIIGAALAFVFRFIMHFCSGFLFYAGTDMTAGAIWKANFIYQCSYVPLDAAICIVLLVALVVSPGFNALKRVMHPTEQPTQQA